ncbi:hypothetical protein HDA44_004534 [Kribbella solani]|uniref:Helix-turn-helix domain-containing protein n=1 Tax=Kribbella solani TaxID=236067 RepID=A0A841DRC5_9ACTN|nr:hypothetical protein [Kribbella solani]
MQEQKYQAVLAVLADGRSVSEVAEQWGVSRQSVHAWLRRYEDEGLAGLAPRSRRPGSCPHQLGGVVEARILELRRVHPGWGPRRILYDLQHDPGLAELDGVVVPSRSGIYRALVRAGQQPRNFSPRVTRTRLGARPCDQQGLTRRTSAQTTATTHDNTPAKAQRPRSQPLTMRPHRQHPAPVAWAFHQTAGQPSTSADYPTSSGCDAEVSTAVRVTCVLRPRIL